MRSQCWAQAVLLSLVAARAAAGEGAAATPGESSSIYRNSTVFQFNEGGYSCFRGPAILQLKSGDLLAFASAGSASDCDYGDIKTVTRKSSDGGQTWGAILVAIHIPGSYVGNTAPIIDSDGIVHVVFARNNTDAFYVRSTDEGVTWSSPLNVTLSVEPHKPPAGVWFAPGPSGGVQTASGALVANARGAFGPNGEEFLASLRSTDGGTSWLLGKQLPIQGQEPSVTSTGGATLATISRAGGGVFGFATSSDSGETWMAGPSINLTAQGFHPPDCQGSLLSDGGRLLLGAPTATDTKGRSGFRVFASHDVGLTWVLHKTLTSDDWSVGYSSMTSLGLRGNGSVGILYESRSCQSPLSCPMGISFAVFL